MIIIDDRSEEKLLRHLDRVRDESAGWRCIHLHMQSLSPPERTEAALAFAARIGGNETYAYFCEQGEVFLLGRDYAVRDVRRAAGDLAQRLGGELVDPLSDFYELGNSLSRLAYLVDERLQVIRAREAASARHSREQQQEQTRRSILNTQVDPVLVSTLSERRSRHSGPVVLVVEDEPFSGRLVEGVLSAANAVTLVEDGQSAILNYARLAPHVVFLDIDLPDITGHDVLQRLQSMDPQSYIIMLSGNADREHILRAMQSGARGFVGKPFTQDKLKQYIDRCPTLKSLKPGEVS